MSGSSSPYRAVVLVEVELGCESIFAEPPRAYDPSEKGSRSMAPEGGF